MIVTKKKWKMDQAVFIYCRKLKKKSQRRFGEWLGMDASLINRIEKGSRKPTNEQRLKLSKAMKMSYVDLKIEMIQNLI